MGDGRKVIGMDYERALREGEATAAGAFDRPHSFTSATPQGRAIHVNGDPRLFDDDLELIGRMMDLAYEQFGGDGG